MGAPALKAPFPWFGGKSRAASLVWQAFGEPKNYVEPFFGSGAVLLSRPGGAGSIETVNDIDCYLANFWRACAKDPDGVAAFADWPVNEADLESRHKWLVAQAEFRASMKADPEFYDVKVAGWWVWGQCSWIGSGWCSRYSDDDGTAGQGVHRQLPHLGNAGQGVHRQLPHLGDAGRGEALRDYLADLGERMRRTRVACGDWKRVLGPSVTWRHGTTAVLLDPPYARGRMSYSASPDAAASVPQAVGEWCTENGDNPKLRIVLCGYAGDYDLPSTWREVPWKAGGGYGSQRKTGDANENAKLERLWLSPACLDVEQQMTMGA